MGGVNEPLMNLISFLGRPGLDEGVLKSMNEEYERLLSQQYKKSLKLAKEGGASVPVGGGGTSTRKE